MPNKMHETEGYIRCEECKTTSKHDWRSIMDKVEKISTMVETNVDDKTWTRKRIVIEKYRCKRGHEMIIHA